MIAVPSADAEAARLRAALSAQLDVVRSLESSVGELSAAWDARRTAYEARIHQLEVELHMSRKAVARVPVYAPVPIATPAPPSLAAHNFRALNSLAAKSSLRAGSQLLFFPSYIC